MQGRPLVAMLGWLAVDSGSIWIRLHLFFSTHLSRSFFIDMLCMWRSFTTMQSTSSEAHRTTDLDLREGLHHYVYATLNQRADTIYSTPKRVAPLCPAVHPTVHIKTCLCVPPCAWICQTSCRYVYFRVETSKSDDRKFMYMHDHIHCLSC